MGKKISWKMNLRLKKKGLYNFNDFEIHYLVWLPLFFNILWTLLGKVFLEGL